MIELTARQQQLLSCFDAPETDVAIEKIYTCLCKDKRSSREMQQYVGAHVWRLNRKWAKHNGGHRIELGQLKRTYRLRVYG